MKQIEIHIAAYKSKPKTVKREDVYDFLLKNIGSAKTISGFPIKDTAAMTTLIGIFYDLMEENKRLKRKLSK